MGFVEILAVSAIGLLGILAFVFMLLFFGAKSKNHSVKMGLLDAKIYNEKERILMDTVSQTFNLDQNSNDFVFKIEPINMVDVDISNGYNIKTQRMNNENRYYFELTADAKYIPNNVNAFKIFKLNCANITKEFNNIEIYPQYTEPNEHHIKFIVCVDKLQTGKNKISIIPKTKNIINMNRKYGSYIQLSDNLSINILNNGDVECRKMDQTIKNSYINIYDVNYSNDQKTQPRKILLNNNNVLNLNNTVISNNIQQNG